MKARSIQTLAVLLFTFITFNSWGQMYDREHQGEFPWKISAGFNAIDYSFRTVEGAWKNVDFQAVPYPSRFTIERELHRSLYVEAAFSYNEYKAGTVINNVPIAEKLKYYSYDVNLKLYLKNLIYIYHRFEPYINGGFGYNTLNSQSKINIAENKINIAGGGGFNYWLFKNNDDCYCQDRTLDRIGLYAQLQGKINIAEPKPDHHVQYAFGVIFKFK